MPYRRIIFSNSQFYHIFNRTIADESAFESYGLKRTYQLLDYYSREIEVSFSRFKMYPEGVREEILKKHEKRIVEIHAFAFMPNHYHFLLKQLVDNGIRDFISRFQNGMAKYINIQRKRKGSLFCNMFKAKYIENEETFFHVSRYIHLNPVTARMCSADDLEDTPLTSFSHYMGKISFPFLTTANILGKHNKEWYCAFVRDQADYQRKIAGMKRLLFDT